MTEIPDPTPSARPAGFRLPLGRRGLMLAALATIGAGTAFNWGWLTAIGAAPLILAVAPCAVMCGLGLCMKGGSKSCHTRTDPAAGRMMQGDGMMGQGGGNTPAGGAAPAVGLDRGFAEKAQLAALTAEPRDSTGAP